MTRRFAVPDLGVGAGLRVPHLPAILAGSPRVDFFEVISENFMVDGGKPLYHLDRVREETPVILHGVALGIGSPAPPTEDYLCRLERLAERVQPAWLSDHLCWTGTPGLPMHELLPLPYTAQAVRRVVERARSLQDRLGIPFALENTSSYAGYRASEMTEWEFITEVCEGADIGLLLDVNNVYVSAFNHEFDAYDFLRGVPHERVVQIHLAGHTHQGKVIIDTHTGEVIEPVWELYRAALELCGPVSTSIEWDDEPPAFERVVELVDTAKAVRADALGRCLARASGESVPSFVEGRSLLPATSDARTLPQDPLRAAAQGGSHLRAALESSLLVESGARVIP